MNQHTRPTNTLALEALEDRLVPATTYLVLDFTPDSHAGSLADTFRLVKTSSGFAPNFFDFNGDRRVDDTDLQRAANDITYKTQQFFGSFLGQGVQVLFGDVTSDTRLGSRYIDFGRQSSANQVAVMYLGGRSSTGAGVIGRAPVASPGFNVEGFGETYTRSIAQGLVSSNPNASPAEFVNRVAQTVAHEFGHMLGLKHTNGYNATNVMSPFQPANAGAARFIEGFVPVEGGGTQNAGAELRASFSGQAAQNGNSGLGGVASHVHEDEDHELADGILEGGAGALIETASGDSTLPVLAGADGTPGTPGALGLAHFLAHLVAGAATTEVTATVAGVADDPFVAANFASDDLGHLAQTMLEPGTDAPAVAPAVTPAGLTPTLDQPVVAF